MTPPCRSCPANSYCTDADTRIPCPPHAVSTTGSIDEGQCVCGSRFEEVDDACEQLCVAQVLLQSEFHLLYWQKGQILTLTRLPASAILCRARGKKFGEACPADICRLATHRLFRWKQIPHNSYIYPYIRPSAVYSYIYNNIGNKCPHTAVYPYTYVCSYWYQASGFLCVCVCVCQFERE